MGKKVGQGGKSERKMKGRREEYTPGINFWLLSRNPQILKKIWMRHKADIRYARVAKEI